MATGFNWVGDYVTFPNGSPQKIIAHALMGGLLAEATGSDFKTGAAAAGLNEALINQLTWAAQGNKDITLMLSQLTGLLAAAAVDGDLEKGSQIAQKATTFNYLYHKEVEEMLREVDSKSTEQEKRAVRERYAALDQQRNDELDALCARDPQRCRGIAISLANDDQKLVDLVGKLRSQGQGGAASAVGFVIGSNLDASSKIAADISSAGGGVLVKLGAEAIKAGVGVTLPSRSGAGKGKGSQGEAAGPDVPQGPKAAGEVVPPAPVVTSGTTRTGVVRTNAADWRVLRDNWDDLGYGQILSTENRAAIAKGKTPKVDDAWVKVFPEDAGLKGERIPMHHVQGSPLTVPLPDTRHLDAHMPGGFRYNPGGPGSALPAYPPKKGAE